VYTQAVAKHEMVRATVKLSAHAMKACAGNVGTAPLILWEVRGQLHTPAAFTPEKNAGPISTGQKGPRAGPDFFWVEGRLLVPARSQTPERSARSLVTIPLKSYRLPET
jgi:hypothetical protein